MHAEKWYDYMRRRAVAKQHGGISISQAHNLHANKNERFRINRPTDSIVVPRARTDHTRDFQPDSQKASTVEMSCYTPARSIGADMRVLQERIPGPACPCDAMRPNEYWRGKVDYPNILMITIFPERLTLPVAPSAKEDLKQTTALVSMLLATNCRPFP